MQYLHLLKSVKNGFLVIITLGKLPLTLISLPYFSLASHVPFNFSEFLILLTNTDKGKFHL